MNKIDHLIFELDKIKSNEERIKYLDSIKNDTLIGKRELVRIAANILIESSFVERNYKIEIVDLLKMKLLKFRGFFSKLIK